MKNALLVGIAALVMVLGLLWFWNSREAGLVPVARFLPSSTSMLVEFPNLAQTAARAAKSPLGAMLADAQISPFLHKPARRLLSSPGFVEAREILGDLQIRRIFAAVDKPRMAGADVLLGLQFAGDSTSAERALRRMHELIGREAGAEAPVSESREGGRLVFRQRVEGMEIVSGIDGKWLALGNSESAALAFLDASRGNGLPDSLEQNAVFQEVRSKGEAPGSDLEMFFAMAPWAELLKEAAATRGAQAVPAHFDRLEDIEAVGYFCRTGTEGTVERKVVLGDEMPEMGGLRNEAMRFVPQDAFAYFAAVLDGSFFEPAYLREALPPMALEWIEQQGLTVEEVAEVPGGEMTAFAWWPESSLIPSIGVVAALGNTRSAEKVLRLALGEIGGEVVESSRDGLSLFTLADPALGLISPTFGIGDNQFFATLMSSDIDMLLAASETGKSLATSPSFASSKALFSAADNSQFTFFDLPGFLARAHTTVRPMLDFAAALSPGLGETVDVSLLPTPDKFNRHLIPVVAVRRQDGRTFVTVLTAPMSFGSLLAATFADAADGFPTIKKLARE